MFQQKTIFSALLAGALCGCTGHHEVSLVEVLNHDQCTDSEAGVEVVGMDDVARIRGGRLLSAPQEPDGAPSDLLLIAVSRGQQPTPGYGFELLEGTMKGEVVTVRLAWNEPPTDAVLAQVITHPCIVIGLEGQGFNTLRVIDDEGTPLGEILLPGA
ncbi:MAG: protease complex subunit PrcB family protein [Pseudomonadales bacterium]|nr:protease complex subunit PrcB family protein [Pseudomonadales bacterium]NIX09975.1 protease complex subunit PrcB family protein [Pseudomonadales bacterium]